MTTREARHAREDAEAAAREAARLTQDQANALVTRLVAESGKPRRKVRVLADVANALLTSKIAYWGGAQGALADGRAWRLECTNPWSGYHLVIG
jgi:hypothetical protein